MQHSLPKLLFQECHKYCVENYELQPPQTVGEKTCIANCQDKTYRAFELFMKANVRFAARKDYRNYVDVSKFTEMEVEHGHDTASQIPHNSDNHIHPSTLQDFQKNVNQQMGDVKQSALQ